MGTRVALIALLCLLLGLVIVTLYRDTSELDRVIKRGELVVATRNTPSTYFEGPDGPMGSSFSDLPSTRSVNRSFTEKDKNSPRTSRIWSVTPLKSLPEAVMPSDWARSTISTRI
jgi:hypothetical protein